MIKRKLMHSLLAIAACALVLLFLVFEDRVSEASLDAMHLAAYHVLPSLFPYTVVSSVIVSLGLFDPICRFIPTERLFRLPRNSTSVILTGMIGGFPTGALGACELYENGALSKSEASRLCALSSVASPAFIIGTVGAIWGRNYALFFLVAQITVAFVIAHVLGRADRTPQNTQKIIKTNKKSTVAVICKSIANGAVNCVTICGYIVFFRVLAEITGALIPPLSNMISVIFEFSSGAATGGRVGGIIGISMTAFAVGFSGLSVFMQILNLTEEHGIPFMPIFVTKLLTGALLSLLSTLFFIIHPTTAAERTVCACIASDNGFFAFFFAAFALAAIYFLARRKYFHNRS